MKNTFIFTFSVLILFSINLNAQWDTISYFNQDILDIETYDGKLFLGGNFTANEGSTCYWSAYYNGSSINRHTYMIGGSGIRGLDEFDGDLYAVGALHHGSYTGISKWDGSSWTGEGYYSISHSIIFSSSNDLYVASDDGVIRNKPAGGNFQTFYSFSGDDDVSCISEYNNEIIVAGDFTSIDGVSANNIAKWDGTNWSPLGSGIGTGVKCMAVYKNELYVAGDFSIAGSTNVNNIAKWDGSSWSDVGNGMLGSSWNGILDMVVFNGVLVVVGDFNGMGSVSSHDVAAWNGTGWISMDLDHNDYCVSSVEVYNNKIYVATKDFNKSHLFKYTGTITGINDNYTNNCKIYPNPAANRFKIEFDKNIADNFNLKVIDVCGKTLIDNDYQSISNNYISVNSKQLPTGIYFAIIKNNNTNNVLYKEKVIIQN